MRNKTDEAIKKNTLDMIRIYASYTSMSDMSDSEILDAFLTGLGVRAEGVIGLMKEKHGSPRK